MESSTAYRPPTQDPPAPVAGGMRWRGHRHEIYELCRRAGGFRLRDPDAPIPGGADACAPEPGASGGPLIASTPSSEARVGTEYVYGARAFDGNVNGFTWYLEKGAPGMTVDRHTGTVTWTPSEGGMVEVALCARSVYGTMSRQSWTICVRRAVAVRKPALNRRFSEALRRKIERRGMDQRAHGLRYASGENQNGSGMPPVRAVWRDARRVSDPECRATAPPVGERLRAAMPLRR